MIFRYEYIGTIRDRQVEVANKKAFQAGKVYVFSMFKKIWLIWCRTVDHRIGKTDQDEPNIPILTLKQAQISLFLRTFLILLNVLTCIFIIINILHKW